MLLSYCCSGKNAEILAEKYGADKDVVLVAAWLHDIASVTNSLG